MALDQGRAVGSRILDFLEDLGRRVPLQPIGPERFRGDGPNKGDGKNRPHHWKLEEDPYFVELAKKVYIGPVELRREVEKQYDMDLGQDGNNQRNNSGPAPDSMCNVTAVASALRRLGVSDDEAREAAAALVPAGNAAVRQAFDRA
ncbi:MAG: hypothetical protein KDK37_11780, partial [Leptospiraceae bacterium]|nr:hypothetical protein [Leptospiraceae bacterium]